MICEREKLRQFDELGYCTGIQVADQRDALRYQSLFNEIEVREGRDKCRTGLYDLHFTVPFVWELATHPTILECVSELIGPNIFLMSSHFFGKYGPSDAFVAWHQDVTYWGLEPPLAVTAWYAIDDSDVENGCMQVIPRTHKSGIRQHGKSADPAANLLSINQEVPVNDDELCRVVDIELSAGQMSLHHGLTIHGSRANPTTRRRCGLALIYLPTFVRQVRTSSLGTQWKTVLVRGENAERYFHERPHPHFHRKPAHKFT
jgi:ectoine hydroxylase-related dioxygenase (phytanoyl-CoA dioxygenase family)